MPPDAPDFEPEQVPPNVAFARVRLVGNVSINAWLSIASLALELFRVIVKVLFPLGAITVGLNDLLNVGGMLTSKLATASIGLFPKSVCKYPAGIVFV